MFACFEMTWTQPCRLFRYETRSAILLVSNRMSWYKIQLSMAIETSKELHRAAVRVENSAKRVLNAFESSPISLQLSRSDAVTRNFTILTISQLAITSPVGEGPLWSRPGAWSRCLHHLRPCQYRCMSHYSWHKRGRKNLSCSCGFAS